MVPKQQQGRRRHVPASPSLQKGIYLTNFTQIFILNAYKYKVLLFIKHYWDSNDEKKLVYSQMLLLTEHDLLQVSGDLIRLLTRFSNILMKKSKLI